MTCLVFSPVYIMYTSEFNSENNQIFLSYKLHEHRNMVLRCWNQQQIKTTKHGSDFLLKAGRPVSENNTSKHVVD